MRNHPIIHENHEVTKENFMGFLRKQKRVELIHESIIERSEVFQTVGAGFFEAFEEKHLRARVELFQYMAQLGHGLAACWHAQEIVDKALDELLRHIFTGQVAFRKFS